MFSIVHRFRIELLYHQPHTLAKPGVYLNSKDENGVADSLESCRNIDAILFFPVLLVFFSNSPFCAKQGCLL